MDEAPREFGFDTRAVHAGQRPDPYTGASATPIDQTAGFVFEDTESASAYFNLQEYGNVYSRIMNPTVAAFEERLANLEGGVGAVAFASGLAAQAALFFALLEPGDRIAVAKALDGGSTAQLNHLARKLQITLDWVDMDDPDGWRGRSPPRRRRSSPRRSRTRAATCSTSPSPPRWRMRSAPRSSSTTRSRLRICAGRSSSVPT